MRLNYQELGAGDPVVILHGLFGSGDNWLQVARSLSDDYRVVLPDMPNHGDSPHGNAMDYFTMSSEVSGFIEELGYGPVRLIGHSMGGKAAMMLALRFSDLVERVVVVDIAPVRYEPSHSEILDAMRSVAETQPASRAEADQLLEEFLPNKMVRAFLLKSYDARIGRWKLNFPLIAGDYEKILDWPQHSGPAFGGPALALYGSDSEYVTGPGLRTMKQLFPGLIKHPIDGAGHWLHAERAADVVQALTQFLR